MYFGDIGTDSHVLRSYLEKNGAICPESANPAEFMLEAIGAGTARQMGGSKDWADRWVDSPEHAENKREIQRLKDEYLTKTDGEPVAGALSCLLPTYQRYSLIMSIHLTNLSASHTSALTTSLRCSAFRVSTQDRVDEGQLVILS